MTIFKFRSATTSETSLSRDRVQELKLQAMQRGESFCVTEVNIPVNLNDSSMGG